MRTQFTKLILAATLGLALAFTFSCSSDDKPDDGGGGNPSGGGNNSGVGSYTEKGNNIANYKTKQIGDQLWMAENLDYKVEGSKCYGEGGKVYDEENSDSIRTLSNAEIQANCTKYGRLYNWATAMALPSSCNRTVCLGQINSPHRGICPTGWHIPSFADWDKLYRFAYQGTDSLDYAAGKRLKAKEDWNNCGPSGSDKIYLCDDTYGFKALPGGVAYSAGSVIFSKINTEGYWWGWGPNEYGSGEAHSRIMKASSNSGIWSEDFPKTSLVSVRCVKD